MDKKDFYAFMAFAESRDLMKASVLQVCKEYTKSIKSL